MVWIRREISSHNRFQVLWSASIGANRIFPRNRAIRSSKILPDQNAVEIASFACTAKSNRLVVRQQNMGHVQVSAALRVSATFQMANCILRLCLRTHVWSSIRAICPRESRWFAHGQFCSCVRRRRPPDRWWRRIPLEQFWISPILPNLLRWAEKCFGCVSRIKSKCGTRWSALWPAPSRISRRLIWPDAFRRKAKTNRTNTFLESRGEYVYGVRWWVEIELGFRKLTLFKDLHTRSLLSAIVVSVTSLIAASIIIHVEEILSVSFAIARLMLIASPQTHRIVRTRHFIRRLLQQITQSHLVHRRQVQRVDPLVFRFVPNTA